MFRIVRFPSMNYELNLCFSIKIAGTNPEYRKKFLKNIIFLTFYLNLIHYLRKKLEER